MRFPGYDPVPDPDDDRELPPFLVRLDKTLNPIALVACFGVGCHIASVWYKEVSFDHVVYDFKYFFMEFLNAVYNGPNDPSRMKRPELSESFVTLSKYSGTPADLKSFKAIGDAYIRETYTGFKEPSFNHLPRNDRLDIPFLNNKLSFNLSSANDMLDI